MTIKGMPRRVFMKLVRKVKEGEGTSGIAASAPTKRRAIRKIKGGR